MAEDGVVQILFPLVFDLCQAVHASDIRKPGSHAVHGVGGVDDDATMPEAFYDVVYLFGL